MSTAVLTPAPTFVEVRKAIQAAAEQLRVPLSCNRAKSLAAQLLTQPGIADPDSYLRITYTDHTGELAVLRVVTQMFARHAHKEG